MSSEDFIISDDGNGLSRHAIYENDSAAASVTSVVLTIQDILEISEQEDPDESTYIKVTMRVYFDGGLLEMKDGAYTASTYIRSSQIDPSGLKIKVRFEAPGLVQ